MTKDYFCKVTSIKPAKLLDLHQEYIQYKIDLAGKPKLSFRCFVNSEYVGQYYVSKDTTVLSYSFSELTPTSVQNTNNSSVFSFVSEPSKAAKAASNYITYNYPTIMNDILRKKNNGKTN